MTRERVSVIGMVALLGAAGVTHFVKPEFYLKIVPRFIPDPDAVVLWSGVAEIILAATIALPRTRRLAAIAAMVFFVVVFPANIQHALDAQPGTTERWATLVRLPIQPLLIWWAYSVARRSPRTR